MVFVDSLRAESAQVYTVTLESLPKRAHLIKICHTFPHMLMSFLKPFIALLLLFTLVLADKDAGRGGRDKDVGRGRPLVVGNVTIPRPSVKEYDRAMNETKEFVGTVVPNRQRSLVWVSKGANSTIRLVASAAGFPNLRLDYFDKTDVSTTDEAQVSAFSFRFGLLGLIEINNGTTLDDTFTPFLGSSRWNNVIVGQVTTSKNISLKTATLSTKSNAWPINNPSLAVSITFYAVPKLITMGDLMFAPGSVKFDVKVDSYAYKSANATSLGIVAALWNKKTISATVDSSEKRVSVSKSELGSLEWIDTVETDKGPAKIQLLNDPQSATATSIVNGTPVIVNVPPLTISATLTPLSRRELNDDGKVQQILQTMEDGDREDDKLARTNDFAKRLVFGISNVARPESFKWDPSVQMDIVSLDAIASTGTDLTMTLDETVVINESDFPTKSSAIKMLATIFIVALFI
jgi:hypothetical protein